MTAGRVIYEGPDYQPVILVVTVLIGTAALFVLVMLWELVAKVRHRSRMRTRMEAWAEARALPPAGRHSGPHPVVPVHAPPDWEDEWLRRFGDLDEGGPE